MKQTRRQFARFFGVVAAGASFLGLASLQAQEERRRGGGGGPGAGPAKGGSAPSGSLVDPAADPMAKNVNYVHKKADLKKADLKIEKLGVKWDQQFCDNCTLYSAPGKKDGDDVGQCALFPGKLVKGKGWCTSWAKKG